MRIDNGILYDDEGNPVETDKLNTKELPEFDSELPDKLHRSKKLNEK